MDRSQNLSGMLDLMIRPAFAVADGTIQYCNHAARQCMICDQTPITDLLETGSEEYGSLTSGSLYLSLRIEDHPFGATVTRMNGFDVFVLEQEVDQPQLQAMALAARELREPLANILTAADKLAAQQTGTDQNQQSLEKNLYRMLRLIGNMSDAARYAEQVSPHQEMRDITAVIGEVFEKASALAERAGIALVFSNYPQSVDCLVSSEKLERAIYNILSNAIKFSQPGDSIDASLTRHGDKLHLTVRDHGSGIPEDLLGSVFSRHLRQPTPEEGRQGIGLGMYMIRSAAVTHGGTVLIQKCADGGTKLTMTLAIHKDPQGNLRTPRFPIDYAGELDHGLIELADVLPPKSFE